jgi:hypothetical protein
LHRDNNAWSAKDADDFEWGADYLAFVDDDETVEAGWLLQMMNAVAPP